MVGFSGWLIAGINGVIIIISMYLVFTIGQSMHYRHFLDYIENHKINPIDLCDLSGQPKIAGTANTLPGLYIYSSN